MTTIEERMARLEIGHRNHEQMMDTALSILERQQDTIEELRAMTERHDAMLQEHRTEISQVQRLWARLVQRYRLDEDDPQEAP